jgi:glycosyltransferase involved in cell wall biosynthesis
MKILINTPDLSLQGGVANHYKGLWPFWSQDVMYNTVGKRSENKNGKFWFPFDIIKYIIKILFWRPDIILLNPSLAYRAIPRETVFLKIALILRKKTIVFIHGWDDEYANRMNKKEFVNIFNQAALLLVLANDYKIKLINWGITIPIFLTTTKVDDRMLTGHCYNSSGIIRTILFLSRIEVEKGIFIALDTFRNLKGVHSELKLRIVGDGNALNEAKKYAVENKISDVIFTGSLSGQLLVNEFVFSDLYLFPTFHGEGMPTSVLEAMAFGLPVITRPVGGLVDFFKDKEMGYLVESHNPDDFIDKIEKLIRCPKLVKKINSTNFNYAKNRFLASTVATNLESLFSKVVHGEY